MADISQISDGTTTWDIKDATARSSIANAITTAGTGLSKSGNTLNHSNSVTAGTAGSSTTTSGSTLTVPYVTYDAQGHITASGNRNHQVTGFFADKNYSTGSGDMPIFTLVDKVRANRLAFLPAKNVIIEKTTDGGTTWVDAGVSDSTKAAIFGAPGGGTVQIPLLNNERSTQCGLRFTITAMNYTVPDGTTETDKYNYWNSTYVASTERYCQLIYLWFYLNSSSDNIRVEVQAAKGNASTTWTTLFNTDFGMTGWSGTDWIKFNQQVFGGYTTQSGQYWNYRITFWSRMKDGQTAFTGTSAQEIIQIKGYGETVWNAPNAMMQQDHIYSYDSYQNATFPGNIYPKNNNSQSLGWPDKRWYAIYANQVYANTSYYGTCSTAAGTAAKVVNCSGFVLATGARISVLFSTANTVAAPTLNVNNTGAIAVWRDGAVTANNNSMVWPTANAVHTFIYNGSVWMYESSCNLMYSPYTAPTNLNITGRGGLFQHYYLNSSVTNGTGYAGHYLHMNSTTSNYTGAQFFLPGTASGAPSWRNNPEGTWSAWDNFFTVAHPPAFSNITGTASASQVPNIQNLNGTATESQLPTAEWNQKGICQPDNDTIVSNNGVLTATGQSGAAVCWEKQGGVKFATALTWVNPAFGWREEKWSDGRLTLYWWEWWSLSATTSYKTMNWPADATPFVDAPIPQITAVTTGQAQDAIAASIATYTPGTTITVAIRRTNNVSKCLIAFRVDGHWKSNATPSGDYVADHAIGDAAFAWQGTTYYPVTNWTVSENGAGNDPTLCAAVRFLMSEDSALGDNHIIAQYATYTKTGMKNSNNGYFLIRRLASAITTYVADTGSMTRGSFFSTLNNNQRQGYVYNGEVSGNLIWGDMPYIVTDCGSGLASGATVTSQTFYVGTTESGYPQTSISASYTTPTS